MRDETRTDDHRAVDVLRWARENGIYVSYVKVGDVEIRVDAVRQMNDDNASIAERAAQAPSDEDDRPPRDYYEMLAGRRG